MAQTYQLTFGRRLVNSFISALVRLGVNLRGTYLLSAAGAQEREDPYDPGHPRRARRATLARRSLRGGQLGAQCTGSRTRHLTSWPPV
jgi:hypothetical protein